MLRLYDAPVQNHSASSTDGPKSDAACCVL